MRAPPPFRSILVLVSAATLSGCAVGPNFKAPTPDVPAAWTGGGAAAAAGQTTPAPADPSAWWTRFNDTELTALIQRAASANLDAKAAVLRIAEARAQRDIAAGAVWPSLDADASSQTTRLSESTPTGGLFSKVGRYLPGASIANPYNQYQLGFDASWELDLFGRVRRSVEAAKADTQAQSEDSRSVLITTLGEVGRAYIDLRATQAKRRIVQDNLATEHDLLNLAGQRRRAGLSSAIDVVRAGAEASSVEAQLPLLDRQINQDINQLSKLLALPPGALKDELAQEGLIPPVPPQVPVGLPADLARRRPDIRAAEARLHGATARIGVAVADLYPKLTLGAQAGYQSQTIPLLTSWASRFFNAGPTLDLPIFEGGRLRATVRLQTTQERAAALDYRRTVLGALHEVDDALEAYGADQARQAALARTVAQNREAVDLARQRYASGVAAFIDVLDAQRSLQQNQLQLADATAAVSTDLVALYKALGGGWE
jgi:NodT family efflux transporter outer membrane factor (OMF) lipoprotein